MKVFFATDIHGSEVCWRKFLNAAAFYKADMVVLGGDVTGKVMVPIVDHGGHWKVTVRGQEYTLDSQQALEDIKTQIRNAGSYPALVTPDELQELSREEGAVDRRFTVEMTQSLDRWLDMADGFSLVSMGWTNPTPWDTFREAPEPELAAKIEAVVSQVPDLGRAIFNFHAPPYGTGLDEAPALDATLRPIHGGAVMKPVGSTAVRDAIVKHQPMLSVHGHIHESRGVKKMGRTLAINPGSVYGDGVLQGAVLDLNVKKAKVTRYLLVNG
jgi:uncharacterized protein